MKCTYPDCGNDGRPDRVGDFYTARCETHRLPPLKPPADVIDRLDAMPSAAMKIIRAAIVVALLAVILAAVTYGWGW